MGINRLQSHLTKIKAKPTLSRLPQNAHLCIDGLGLLSDIQDAANFEPQFGGSYDLLDRSIREEIQRLCGFGIAITVFMDGRNTVVSEFKGESLSGRARLKDRIWNRFISSIANGNVDVITRQATRLAGLSKEQFLFTLTDLGVDIVHCDGEAELEIARVVRCNNRRTASGVETHFAYGNDTDFMVMSDVPYIEIGDISTGVEGLGAQAPVYRREYLADLMGLTESQFVEFCLLLGNDFTGVFPKSMMQSLVGPVSHFTRNVDHALTYVTKGVAAAAEARDPSTEFRLFSTDERLEKCIQYSRLFYSTGYEPVGGAGPSSPSDTETKTDTETSSPSSARRKPSVADFRRVPSEMYQEIKDMMIPPDITSLEVGYTVLQLIMNHLPRPSMPQQVFVTAQQHAAFFEMLRLMHSSSTADVDRVESLISTPFPDNRICLDDVVASTFFQQVCRLMLARVNSVVDERVSPMQVFHGKLFHALRLSMFRRDPPATVFRHFGVKSCSVCDLTALRSLLGRMDEEWTSTLDGYDLPRAIATKLVNDLFFACKNNEDPDTLLTEYFCEKQADVACFIIRNYTTSSSRGRRIVVHVADNTAQQLIRYFVTDFGALYDLQVLDRKRMAENDMLPAPPMDKTQVVLVTADMFAVHPDVECVIDLCHACYVPSGRLAIPLATMEQSGRRLGNPYGENAPARFRLLPQTMLSGPSKVAVITTNSNKQVVSSDIKRAMLDMAKSRYFRFPKGYRYKGLEAFERESPYSYRVAFKLQAELDELMHYRGGGGTSGEVRGNHVAVIEKETPSKGQSHHLIRYHREEGANSKLSPRGRVEELVARVCDFLRAGADIAIEKTRRLENELLLQHMPATLSVPELRSVKSGSHVGRDDGHLPVPSLTHRTISAPVQVQRGRSVHSLEDLFSSLHLSGDGPSVSLADVLPSDVTDFADESYVVISVDDDEGEAAGEGSEGSPTGGDRVQSRSSSEDSTAEQYDSDDSPAIASIPEEAFFPFVSARGGVEYDDDSVDSAAEDDEYRYYCDEWDDIEERFFAKLSRRQQHINWGK